MSYYLGRIQQISPKNIIPCNYRICLCIEYLDMKEKRNFEKYKQCFITHEINSKYNKNTQNRIYEKLFNSYTNNNKIK